MQFYLLFDPIIHSFVRQSNTYSAKPGKKSRQRRGYHPQLVAAYHQCGALYIIRIKASDFAFCEHIIIAKAIQPTVDEILANA